ncbi:MAG: tetratricopeptide repeat protein [Gemmatimonadaceae bacterium]
MKDRDKWLAAACACLAVLLYVNTLNHGYALDDYPTIYGNRLTTSGVRAIPTMLHTAYWYGLDGLNDWLYRPLSLVMFAIEWQIAPATPALGHWVNVILYALTAVVLFRFLRDLFDGYSVLVPFAIALLWIAHPIHTEVVANIKSRDELLAFLFSVLTMWQCVKYVSAPMRKHLLLAGVYFFLALLSKESPITLLVIVPMTLFVFRRPDAKTMRRAVTPVGIAAVIYMGIRTVVLTNQMGTGAISLIDNSLIAAPDVVHRQATAFYIGGLYLRLLFFPHPMSSDYSYPQVPIVGFDNPRAIGSLVIHVGMFVYALIRLPKRDPVAYGILFYLGSIALVANVLFLTHSTMADRFLYASSFGFCIVLVFLLARLFRLDLKSPNETRLWATNPAFASVVGLLLVASVVQTWARNPDWRDDTSLFAADARHSPNSARIHFLYGNHMLQELKQGKVAPSRQEEYYTIALAEYRRAIALYPAYAEPHMGIGDAYTYRKDYSSAVRWYTDIVARNPRFAAGYIFLGNTFVSIKDYTSAIGAFQKAVTIDPNDAGANYLLGTTYRTQGDSARGQPYLEKAYALDPRMRP